ncbi:MAG: response regulator [Anaerolineae bacterium]|jgi:signal transduction histidine kinase
MSKAATSQPTILVVEDEPHILDIVTYFLESDGYRVIQAQGGQTGLTLVAEHSPDLIISDVNMPGMDGFVFCEHVRANPQFSHIPFIFLTARGERADMRRGMALGADDYVIKPFEPEDLLSAVNVRLTRVAETQAAIHQAGADLQDQIIRTLTHEFRTPLALVMGYTELLENNDEEMDPHEFSRVLEGLHTGSSRLMALVEDFLLLSKLQAGVIAREVEHNPIEPIPPDPVVRLVVQEAEAQAAARKVSLITDCQASGIRLAIIEGHLADIVRRLLDNAIKFSKRQGGTVRVSTQVKDEEWVLTIADRGVGIRREALASIFEAFRQVDRARLEQQGAGVGLTIVRGLVQVHGGRIDVQSTLGEGTISTIHLPLPARLAGA